MSFPYLELPKGSRASSSGEWNRRAKAGAGAGAGRTEGRRNRRSSERKQERQASRQLLLSVAIIMVTISKPLSASQAQAYHAEGVHERRAELLHRRRQIRGEWHGQLAEEWGLNGEVTKKQFARLAEGQHPETGEQLVRHQSRASTSTKRGETVKAMEHRAGWDATFSAPKSVRLTALVGGDDRVREAHRESVGCRPGRDGAVRSGAHRRQPPAETTGKWVAAKFEHDSARPVDGYAAPQLHTHVVFFNVTETGERRDAGAATAGAVSNAAVRDGRLSARSWPCGCRSWAMRSSRARAARRRSGATRRNIWKHQPAQPADQRAPGRAGRRAAPRPAQIAAHRTRDAKLALSPEEMLARHREMAEAFGNQPDRIVEAAKEKMHSIDHERRGGCRHAQSAVTFARDRNLEREAVVDERALMRDALKRSMGQASFEEVRSHFEERIEKGDLIEVKTPVGRSFTTPEMMTSRTRQHRADAGGAGPVRAAGPSSTITSSI